jgi:fructoselysine-6-P-deglycase FrlB-like protein
MRARGLVASSELAASQLLPNWAEGTLVVATSASGGSAETLDALGRLPASVHTVALTNTAGSAITKRCNAVVDLAAEPEVGGVACRSYQHTLALLLALECHLTGNDTGQLAHAVALPAVGCETGDWSHVDVYLTKTIDYRLLVFAGSKWEAQLAEWTTERGSSVIGVGGSCRERITTCVTRATATRSFGY